MDKREGHKKDLICLLEEYFETGHDQDLIGYIVSNSNLPGPRGNLELAQAFGDLAQDCTADNVEGLWRLSAQMAGVSAEEAPVNAPAELVPFCGALSMGAIGSISTTFYGPALSALRELASDSRWRMREAVRFGLQRLLARRWDTTLHAFDSWVEPGAWLEMRAAATAVAEPLLLEDPENARAGLTLHRRIIDQLVRANHRRNDAFKAFRKGLAYSLSVVVAALPNEGFPYLAQLADSRDSDMLWVLKQNLKKSRLVKHFPQEVEAIWRRLPA